MNPMRRLKYLAVLFSAFVLPGSPAASAAAPPDACSVLTLAQVGAVLGASVSTMTPDPKKLCIWNESHPKDAAKSATLAFWDLAAFPSARSASVAGIVATPVKGIGDDAVYAGPPESGGNSGYPGKLFVKKNGLVFSITVLGFPIDQAKEKTKTLALSVVPKL
ncbi:MAG TPA: hypothetical protein VKS01_11760 [Bryobacteraceae bacterium]|nr:hypothetical protein [Bryobacteraceae bacterium]